MADRIPMSNAPLYPPPPPELATWRWKHLVTFLGPGVIIASVTIGSGELVWASRSGAVFGYGMLWCFLYAGIFKAIQVYTAARHITLTGEHPMVGWKGLPGPPLWFPLLIAVPAVAVMPVAFSAIPEMLGGFIHRLVGLPTEDIQVGPYTHLEFWINVWTSVTLCTCLALAVLSSYTVLERTSTVVLAVMVICVACSVIVLGPNVSDILAGLLIPRVPQFPHFVTQPQYVDEFSQRSPWLEVSLYLTAVGGGAYDYIGYVGMLRQKKWGLAGSSVATRDELDLAVANSNSSANETIRRARQWTVAPLIDAGVSFFFVILVTLLFAMLGSIVLHTASVIPANNDLLSQQEAFVTVLHPELRWLYRTAVFLAFLGTLYGAFQVYRYTFTESVAAIAPNWATPARMRFLGGAVIAYCFLGGLFMVWLPVGMAGSIVQRMTLGSIVSGATSCGLWCFAMIWLDTVRLPPPLRMSWPLRAMTLVAGLSMTLLGVQTIIAYFS